jgi:photosystem II stability/assembly factor-like uncharacterized protein
MAILSCILTLFACQIDDIEEALPGPPEPTALSQNEPIQVEGEVARISLHSVDFIDQNNGWMVQTKDHDEGGSYSQTSQILRTQDGGNHWENIELSNVLVLWLRFLNSTEGWALARTGCRIASGNQVCDSTEILHTQDGGNTWDVQWKQTNDPSTDSRVWMSHTDLVFPNPTHGYALVEDQLLTTQDGGKQWYPISFDVDGFVPDHISFTNAETGWVIGRIVRQSSPESPSVSNQNNELMVLQTVDGGKHWKRQWTKTYPPGPVGSVDIRFVNPITGWFLTSDTAAMSGDLYYTSNGGQKWQKINQIKSARPTPSQLSFVTTKVGFIPLDVGAGPIAGGLMKTQDGGKSFDIIQSDENAGSLHEVTFLSERAGWAVGTSLYNSTDYLMRTNDGGNTWEQIYPRLRPTRDISFTDDQHGYGLGQLTDAGALLRSTDGGETWHNIHRFSPKLQPIRLSFTNRDVGWVLAVSWTGRTEILRTVDGGVTWSPIGEDIPQVKDDMTAYFRFFNQNDGVLAETASNDIKLYRTQDGGKHWRETGQEQPKDVEKHVFAFISPAIGWDAVSTSENRQSDVAIKTTTDGSSWSNARSASSGTYAYGIDFISEERGWMLAEERPFSPNSRWYLFVTSDGGKTWVPSLFPDSFQPQAIKDRMPIQFTDAHHGWILSSQGLLRTQDGGRSWTWLNGSS